MVSTTCPLTQADVVLTDEARPQTDARRRLILSLRRFCLQRLRVGRE
jgi:hypothetical protein